MGNAESFRSEELVVQEGPNKGAVKDVELARIGAEAENAVIEEHSSTERDVVGNRAMNAEVFRRAKATVETSNITPDAKQAVLNNAVRDFGTERFQKSQELIKDQTESTAKPLSRKQKFERTWRL